ncbi:uncharacterized protein si:ch211-80h18.1 isoform X3 [Alosa sapidissima]|uniref:uncharacterized protein si:ch211-80h18.1 isoform X3 n=1 Tax=Alosa sapidissima TaxID=34773 RepID=UPI001C08EB69|nr:uncharacterized protein si:ch211-80h18.1 isoform X3 [Alosa sapidissima]
MLSRNLLIASAVVFLATTVSTAPVEEKEPEDTEVETEDGEEEVSEEDADDDDDSSQDLNKGTGAQHATTVSKDLGATPHPGMSAGESSNGQKHTADSAAHSGQDASSSSSAAGGFNGESGRDPHTISSDPGTHASTVNGGSSTSEAGAAGAEEHGISVSQVHADSHTSSVSHDSSSSARGDSVAVHSHEHSHPDPAESDPHLGESQVGGHGDPFRDPSQIEAPGSSSAGAEVPETENNGNGHKHLVGGPVAEQTDVDHFIEGTTQIDSTGGVDAFGGSHGELTGIVDQANADFFIDLMGGMVDAYGPDAHVDTLGMLSVLTESPSETIPKCLITEAVSADHMGFTFPLDPTAVGLDPGQPSSSSRAPDAPPAGSLDPSSFDHHSPDLSGADHSAVDHTRFDHVSVDHAGLDYWPDALAHTHVDAGTADHIHSNSGFTADATDPALPSDIMLHADHSIIDYPEGGADTTSTDTAHSNGNGRHRPVTEPLRGDHPGFDIHHDSSSTVHQPITAADAPDTGERHGVVSPLDTTAGTFEGIDHTHGPQTDMAGGPSDAGTQVIGADAAGGEPVTNVHIQVEATAMGAIYGSSPPDTVGHEGVTDAQARFTDSQSGPRHSFTDMVDSHSLLTETDAPVTEHAHGVLDHTGVMDSVTAGPQGTVGGSSQPGVTEQTQAAVSAGEQYNTSGQGPEENVELEDTC